MLVHFCVEDLSSEDGKAELHEKLDMIQKSPHQPTIVLLIRDASECKVLKASQRTGMSVSKQLLALKEFDRKCDHCLLIPNMGGNLDRKEDRLRKMTELLKIIYGHLDK